MKNILILLFLLSEIALFSQENVSFNPQSLDEKLAELIQQNEPGAQVIITSNQQIVYENNFGLANLERSEKLNSEHLLGIASMSKQFTGMAVLLLENDGKLSLEDDIRTYFPELKITEPISIRQLLSHTSGLPELTQNDRFLGDIDQQHSVSQVIDYIFMGEYRSHPGEKYMYCNSGYILMVALVEKLSKMPFSEFLEQRIFDPLQMQHTTVCDFNTNAEMAVQRYERDGDGFKKAEQMHFSNLIGGGSIVSNAQDMAKWCIALANGTQLPANYQKIWESNKLNSGEETGYGLGLGNNELDGYWYVYHPGMGSGMNSVDLIFPDQKLTVTVIRNISAPAHSAREIAFLMAHYALETLDIAQN